MLHFCGVEEMLQNELKSPEEWLLQASYDLETADAIFGTGRYMYTVFMCHLSIEKALKGLYTKKLEEEPPKTHNLIYLIEKIGIQMPDNLYDFVFSLNRVSVPTRYPDDLKRILKDYDKDITKEILTKSKDVLKWLKERL
jgi:HEPN domain-containing protein